VEKQQYSLSSPAVLAALAVLAAFAVAALWTTAGLGAGGDEFYTYFVARPEIPLGEAVAAHWLPDNHPPLFYALARAFWWLGDTIEYKRLINVVFLGLALGGGIAVVRRQPALHRLSAAYLIVLASQGLGVRYVVDYRSYFLSLAAMAVLVLAIVVVHCGTAQLRRGQTAALWAATIVAFNVHITTSILAAATLVPFLGWYLGQRDFDRFWRLALPALAGGLVFSAISLLQMKHWLGNTTTFWLPAGLSAARWALEMTMLRAAQANAGLLFAGAAGLVLLTIGAIRNRSIDQRLGAAILLGIGTVLATAIVVAIHLWRPFVYERYLLGYIPLIAMGLALGSDAVFDRLGSRWTAALLAICVAFGLVSVWRAAVDARWSGSWAESAAMVGRMAGECPGTIIHTNEAWNRDVLDMPPADNRAVLPMAYAMMAQRYGFRVEQPQSRRLAAGCHTLFWAEIVRPEGFSAADILAQVRADGFAVNAVTVYQFNRSFVAVVR
jgi:hypothetical protein